MNDFAHAQVSYFNLSLFCEKNILQFDVSVDDAFLMQVFDCVDESGEYVPEF